MKTVITKNDRIHYYYEKGDTIKNIETGRFYTIEKVLKDDLIIITKEGEQIKLNSTLKPTSETLGKTIIEDKRLIGMPYPNELKETVMFSKTKPNAIIPSRDSENGCYDVYSCFEEDELVINPHEIKMIPTGIKSVFHESRRIGVRERGSTGSIGLATRCGQIDSGYRGEWFICLQNTTVKPIIISKKVDKKTVTEECVLYPYKKAIAQFAVEIVPNTIIIESTTNIIDSIPSKRGNGMLGSSQK